MSTFHQATSGRASKKERKSQHIWLIGLAAFLFVIAASLIFPWFLKTCCGLAQGDTGAFGDQYGALNTFFSGLAFAGLVIAILLQREDLKLQREEMREARAEAAKQTKEAEAQTALMAEQTLSANLFSYLEAMQKNRDAIFLPTNYLLNKIDQEKEYRGQEAIQFIARHFFNLVEHLNTLNYHTISTIRQTSKIPSCIQDASDMKDLFNNFFQIQPKITYLRNWATPLFLWNKRVHQSALPPAKQQEYEEQFFGSLSLDEQTVLQLYAVITHTPLHMQGSKLSPSEKELSQLLFDRLQIKDLDTQDIYKIQISLLYHLFESNCYHRDAKYLSQLITDFYESRLDDILREYPTSMTESRPPEPPTSSARR